MYILKELNRLISKSTQSHKNGPVICLSDNFPRDNTVFVPAFAGKSYLELPTLKHVSKAFQIEVWFLAFSRDGMILFNGQNPNGHGDFLSINLVQVR